MPTPAQFLAYSLAELSSAYPTSGGLYYWAYMTAPPKYKMLSCYVVAWSMIISTPLACVSITYSVSTRTPLGRPCDIFEPCLQAAQLLVAAFQLAYPNYTAEAWHIYLVYLGMML